MLGRFLFLLAAVAFMGSAGQAQAHSRSQSFSSWQVDGRTTHMSFTVAQGETARLTPDGEQPGDAELIAYLSRHVGMTAGGKTCPHASPGIVQAAAGFRKAEFVFSCPDRRDTRIVSSAFTGIAPAHVNFAQIQTSEGAFAEQLLTLSEPSASVTGADAENSFQGAGFLRFVGMGIMHIFTGFDHMSFLVGLVLISRRLRDLTFVVTGFTIGHSLTLALAVTGILQPHAEYIDALVALTILLVGVENLAANIGRPGLIAAVTGGALLLVTGLRLAGFGSLPPLLLLGAGLFSSNYLLMSGHLRDAGRLRLVVTLVFGLIHGFGFATDLLESRLPRERLAELLAGFNLGVEIAQLALVLTLTLVTAWLVRLRWAPPRAIVADIASAALICIGTCWFVARSFV